MSIIYYLGVVATWVILWLDRKSAKLFSNKYLKTGRYPFTFIAASAFALVEILRGLIYIYGHWTAI